MKNIMEGSDCSHLLQSKNNPFGVPMLERTRAKFNWPKVSDDSEKGRASF